MRALFFSGALRLGCSTVQVRSWPEYKDDIKCTEERTRRRPSPRSSVTDTEPRLLLLLPTCQVSAAAGAALSTEQSASVYSSPSSHRETEPKVMFGGAAWEAKSFWSGCKTESHSMFTTTGKYIHTLY